MTNQEKAQLFKELILVTLGFSLASILMSWDNGLIISTVLSVIFIVLRSKNS